MIKRQIILLKNLIETPSPSGFEENIARFIRKELLKFLPKNKIEIDFQNNVIVKLNTSSDKTVMIDAHLDTIGFIITNITKHGLINIKYIGGGDTQILSARHLNILTEKGIINAVVDRKHSHLITNEDDEKIDYCSEAEIDIGIRNRKQIHRIVKIGDPVVYKSYFYYLSEGKSGKYYAGYGFDDKSGCYILLEVIRNIYKSRKKIPYNLIFTFSSQEETGKTKAKPLVKKYKPDLFVEVDVTFATDYGSLMEENVGKCELGKGGVLYRGVDIDKNSLKFLEKIARKNKIKIQYQASQGNIGYTACEVSNYPTKILIIGIPLRNMHTPVEIINSKDLDYIIRLLTQFLLNKKIKTIL